MIKIFQVEIIQLLLDRGARWDIEVNGKTIYQHAMERGMDLSEMKHEFLKSNARTCLLRRERLSKYHDVMIRFHSED